MALRNLTALDELDAPSPKVIEHELAELQALLGHPGYRLLVADLVAEEAVLAKQILEWEPIDGDFSFNKKVVRRQQLERELARVQIMLATRERQLAKVQRE